MRAALDTLYRACGVLAGVFLILIAAIILLQIGARELHYSVPSTDDFAGMCMAASAFLGLAPTLRAGAHIRVTLLLGFLPPVARRGAEVLCLLVAIALSAYFARWAFTLAYESWEFNDRSPGVIPVPLWLPQSGMVIGLVVLLIAFIDDLVTVVRGGTPSYEVASETALESDRLGDALGASASEPRR